MKGFRTPKKDHQITNGRSKSVSERNKKLQKVVTENCLDPAFPLLLGDDVALDSQEESLEQYELSEISEVHHLDESAENFFLMNPLPPFSPRDSIGSSNLILSPASTITKQVTGDNLVTRGIIFETENSSDRSHINASVEIDLLVNHLKLAQTQVTNSTGGDPLSRKLLHKLLDVVIEDFIGVPNENAHFEKLSAMKLGDLFLGFMLVFLTVAIFLFCFWEKSSYKVPLPT